MSTRRSSRKRARDAEEEELEQEKRVASEITRADEDADEEDADENEEQCDFPPEVQAYLKEKFGMVHASELVDDTHLPPIQDRLWDEEDDPNATPKEEYDPEAFIVNSQPEPRPDGEPQHIFYAVRNESVLSAKLVLWGGWKGIVSFEGLLTKNMKPVSAHGDSRRDIKFLRELQLGEMSKGAESVPVYRFLCVPETHYSGNRMPNGNDIVNELKNTDKFNSHQRARTLSKTNIPYPPQRNEHDDEIHTDPKKQYIFTLDSERHEAGDDEELQAAAEKSIAAHKALRKYVRNQHLYYAVFHTKENERDEDDNDDEGEDERMCDYVYVFAVGVSPHSGNLVGVFSMQASSGLTA